MKQKVYNKLALSADARLTCIQRNNTEWIDRHTETIENIIKNNFPHGSGIDGKTEFDFNKSNGEKLIVNSEFHVLDKNGYYDGWINYTLTIKASLMHNMSLSIVGNFGKHQDIKDYLYEVYRDALEQEI